MATSLLYSVRMAGRGIVAAAASGCLYTGPIGEGKLPDDPPNTPPSIDVSDVKPKERVRVYDAGAGCPKVTFSVGRIVDPDPPFKPCEEKKNEDPKFAARFFVTTLPADVGKSVELGPPVFEVPLVRQVDDCNVLQLGVDFDLDPARFPSPDWSMVELIVSDGFQRPTTTFRDVMPGRGSDAYVWIVRGRPVACP